MNDNNYLAAEMLCDWYFDPEPGGFGAMLKRRFKMSEITITEESLEQALWGADCFASDTECKKMAEKIFKELSVGTPPPDTNTWPYFGGKIHYLEKVCSREYFPLELVIVMTGEDEKKIREIIQKEIKAEKEFGAHGPVNEALNRVMNRICRRPSPVPETEAIGYIPCQ